MNIKDIQFYPLSSSNELVRQSYEFEDDMIVTVETDATETVITGYNGKLNIVVESTVADFAKFRLFLSSITDKLFMEYIDEETFMDTLIPRDIPENETILVESGESLQFFAPDSESAFELYDLLSELYYQLCELDKEKELYSGYEAVKRSRFFSEKESEKIVKTPF